MDRSRVFASKYFIGFVVCLTIFTDVFIYGLVLPVLPHALHDRAGTKDEDLQFWSTVLMAFYAGMILVGSIVFGFLGDRLNDLRWTFILGQMLLLVATVVFAFAKALPFLVIARILQGFSCGAVFTVGYSLLYNAVGTASIGQALGYTSMSLSFGVFAGPIVGGVVYDAAGYRMVFLPAIILIALEIILRFMVIEPPPRMANRQQRNEREPLLNGHTVDAANKIHTDEANASGTNTNHNQCSRSSDAEAAPSTEMLSKQKSPMLILMQNPRFLTSFVSLFLLNNFTAAFETILPVFSYERFHFTSTQTALLYLCITVPVVFSPIAGHMTDRFGAKIPALSGFFIGGAAMLSMLVMDYDKDKSTEDQLKVLACLLVLFGVSFSLTLPPVYSEVSATVEQLEADTPGIFGDKDAVTLAFGLETAAWGAGAMIGPIYSAVVKEKFGFGVMGAVLGVISLILCVPVALFTGRRLFKKAIWGVDSTTNRV